MFTLDEMDGKKLEQHESANFLEPDSPKMDFQGVVGHEVDIVSLERKKDIKSKINELEEYYLPREGGIISVE